MDRITLYGYAPSPFVKKVAGFLYHKELPFEFVPVNPLAAEETIGFTSGTQVPVLAIEDEWQLDSTRIGLWLDKRFPDRPLLPTDDEEREKILAIDRWLNEMYFPSFFRWIVDSPYDARFRAWSWRYAAMIDAGTPLDATIRTRWPDLQRSAHFIHNMIRGLDRDESLGEMNARLERELLTHLGSGPFLGESLTPTLVDLAIYPSLVSSYLVGIDDTVEIARLPIIKSYLMRIAFFLPENPLLVPEEFLVNKLAGMATANTTEVQTS